jgi:2-polyprenyl-3-methyl-5-hydroxy-6-metoxy-1,4-benzoquinol methylase
MSNSNTLQSLSPVMEKYGVTCSPEKFHEGVNLAFHRAESRVYDEIHKCMWESLPRQMNLLVGDCIAAGAATSQGLAALDIGCGTGLASELLLRSDVGRFIAGFDLLDTSAEMLERIKSRASGWAVKSNFLHGDLSSVAAKLKKYDIIVTCSVLHHIPDLPQFLTQVRSMLAPNGVFIHLQDPNGDYLQDPNLIKRMHELKQYRPPMPKWLLRLSPRRIAAKIRREISGEKSSSYLTQVNDDLLSSHLINRPMSEQDIWRVTDIHVHDGEGISTNRITEILEDCKMVSRRSYAFFGKMFSELPIAFQKKEDILIGENAPDGLQVAAAWKAPEA